MMSRWNSTRDDPHITFIDMSPEKRRLSSPMAFSRAQTPFVLPSLFLLALEYDLIKTSPTMTETMPYSDTMQIM